MTIRVLIADDHPVVRSGLRSELGYAAGIEVVGEASDGEEVLCLVEELKPDVILLDIKMPGMKAIQVLGAIQAKSYVPAVLILSAYGDPENVQGMLKAGARGYLLKDSDPETIAEGLRAVAGGATFITPALVDKLVKGMAIEQAQTGIDELSSREQEVLELLGQGYTNQRIADEMGIKKRTVRFHLENLMSKMSVNSRIEAVLTAVQRGWLDL